MADLDHSAPEDPETAPPVEPLLDEDDIFAAILGLPGTGAFWGSVPASPSAQQEPEWSEEADRRRRREEILGRWEPRAESSWRE